MKHFLLTCLMFVVLVGRGQSTVSTLVHNGLTRSYRIYVPGSYSGNVAVPLLFNLHGYTSNALQQEFYGDFRDIADTANFILVHPDGTVDPNGNTYWNAFGAVAGIDDVGFISALIDKIDQDYNIDLNRVYSCGMSNGGFMSYRLACELADRITAVASVTGTMPINAPANCNPDKPTPVMQIHGTADPTVPYNGNASIMAIEALVNWWVNFNQCSITPSISNVPNTNINDMCTAERYLYTGGNNGSTVELFKVTPGAHTWPGAPIVIGVTNMDFNASVEIWRFFRQYSMQSLLSIPNTVPVSFKIYPNPVGNEDLVIDISKTNPPDFQFKLYDLTGKLLFSTNLNEEKNKIETQYLQKGLYLITISDGLTIQTCTLIKSD